ncbi:hypothetical protein POL68_18850 [Stigmatella sp. ncwal1]|uniref:Uncharacterized protein n=1 Tax=Stigmatella ashevillensis TaxID=2995309 RepID=A0ABT5DA22_9BACT|nr:hypothetical protein [Stigmatella ashevillena]MDC0710543.1 hypothetical protein [Stigmatella ashevillena]
MKNAVFCFSGRRALALAVSTLAGALMLAPEEAAAMALPQVDFSRYCRDTYGASASAVLTQPDANGWKCRVGAQDYSVNPNAACQQQHVDGYEAAYLDLAVPSSWYCRLRASYTSMANQPHTLYAWKGRNIALRVPNSNCGTKTGAEATQAIMKIVDAADDAYDFYYSQTSTVPPQDKHYQGLLSIAALPAGAAMGCAGSACGFPGRTGIELSDGVFQQMCNTVSQTPPLYDQTLFYELGRNFYFYSSVLSYKPPQSEWVPATGFAIAMRFLAMEAAGLSGAPIGSISFNTSKSEVEALVDSYRYNPNLRWSNTLATNLAPSNAYGLGGADLFASIVLRLERRHPGWFVHNVWWYAGSQSTAYTTVKAVDNFVTSACLAASANLYNLFKITWKFDVTMTTASSVCSGYGPPVNPINY